MEREWFKVMRRPKWDRLPLVAGDPAAELCEMIHVDELRIERIVYAVNVDRSAHFNDTWYLEARLARWPANGRLVLPASWRDGARAELYERAEKWLRPAGMRWHRRAPVRWWRFRVAGGCARLLYRHGARLLDAARKRWPVAYTTYHAELYFPYAIEVAGLAPEVREDAFGRWRKG